MLAFSHSLSPGIGTDCSGHRARTHLLGSRKYRRGRLRRVGMNYSTWPRQTRYATYNVCAKAAFSPSFGSPFVLRGEGSSDAMREPKQFQRNEATDGTATIYEPLQMVLTATKLLTFRSLPAREGLGVRLWKPATQKAGAGIDFPRKPFWLPTLPSAPLLKSIDFAAFS